MPRFRDDNTLEDIHGTIVVAMWWPECPQKIDIHQEIAEIEERIQDKIARNRNAIRHNWFNGALELVHQAKEAYRQEQIERGRKLLRSAWEQLESGNKAHRRTTHFIVGRSGETSEKNHD